MSFDQCSAYIFQYKCNNIDFPEMQMQIRSNHWWAYVGRLDLQRLHESEFGYFAVLL